MNPHQAARVVSENNPLRTLNGEPSLINYLDALNSWQLVRAVKTSLGLPAAASFKHVSPAGVATPGPLDETMQETWGIGPTAGPVTSAYVRARDGDPKSSYGDVIALSDAVDLELADFLEHVVSDAIVAPSFETGVVQRLSRRKKGRFLILEMNTSYVPPEWESIEVFGVHFEQQRDALPITSALFEGHGSLSERQVRDGLLSLATLRYTQSNSIALVRDGMAIGIGAGQQNRVDCVRLAGSKAKAWWLRRHPKVRRLNSLAALSPIDLVNWQIRYASGDLSATQRQEFARLFGFDPSSNEDQDWRNDWLSSLTGVTLGSDGFIPFKDNIDYAAEVGVDTVFEPGGSIRTGEVHELATELGMRHIQTNLRLFHH